MSRIERQSRFAIAAVVATIVACLPALCVLIERKGATALEHDLKFVLALALGGIVWSIALLLLVTAAIRSWLRYSAWPVTLAAAIFWLLPPLVVGYLVQRPTVNKMVLAGGTGDLRELERALAHGIDIDAASERPTDFGTRMTPDQTVLTSALFHHQSNVVRYLVKHGADVNRADGRGNTPLYVASVQGESELVQLLLDTGARLEFDQNGKVKVIAAVELAFNATQDEAYRAKLARVLEVLREAKAKPDGN